MQIDDFEYLLAVAEHANMGRAAQALGISQPALTKAVRRMEASAGLQLFTRSAKGVQLTEAGGLFLRRGRNIWLEYEDARREMQQMRSCQLGRLRVGFSPSVSGELVMASFAQLLRERPAAMLQLRERLVSELVDMLLAGKLDLILAAAMESTAYDAVRFERLYTDRFEVVCDRDHPLRQRQSLSLADLAQAQWILPSETVRARQWLAAAFRSKGLPEPAVRVEAEFGRVSIWPLAQGSGLLTLCNDSNLPAARRRGLEVLPVLDLDMQRQVGVMTRAGGWRSPLSERLTQLLKLNADSAATPS